MKRNVYSAVIALTILLSTPWLSDGACLAPDVVVFFGNGILTGPDDYEKNRSELQEFLNKKLPEVGQPPCQILVQRAINRTEGVVTDLWESAKQSFPLTLFTNVLSWAISDRNVGAFIVSKILDLNHQGYVSTHDEDLQSHLRSYRQVLNAAGRVLVVAHSQGNLFANEAYDRLLQEYGPTLATRMKIIAVATPDDRVAGTVFVPPGPHTTLLEDFIHLVPGALGPNTGTFPPPPDPDGCLLPWDCHALIGSYLDSQKGAFTRARILQKVRGAFGLPLAFSGGTYAVRNSGVVGTAFLFNPVTAFGTFNTTVGGPPGWNGNNTMSVFRYQPPGTASTRSFFFSGVQPVTGAYTLTAFPGGQVATGVASINAASTLAAPEITGIVPSTSAVTVNWSASGAQSFVVYLHNDPVGTTPVRQQVVNGSATSHIFAGLSLTSGQAYRAEVFSLSQDVLTPGAFGDTFNISSSGTVRFTTPSIVLPTITKLVSSSNFLVKLSIGGSTLAFIEDTFNCLTQPQRLLQVPTTGGTVTPLASGLICPRGVLNDGTNVYWIDGSPTNGAIRRIPIGGGTITTLTTGIVDADYRLLSDGTNLYFSVISYGTNVCAIRKMPLPGGTVTDLVTESSCNVLTFTINSGVAYYYAGLNPGATGAIKRVSTAGGTVTTMTTNVLYVFDLLVSGAKVYWSSAGNPGTGIFSVATAAVSNAPTTLVSGITGRALATDGNSLYVAAEALGVLRYSLSNFASVTTLYPSYASSKLALDGESVYFSTDFDNAIGRGIAKTFK